MIVGVSSPNDSVEIPANPHGVCVCVLVVQVIQKWCLLVLSALLADATLKQWALPSVVALQPLQLGADEACSSLEDLVALLVKGYGR